nr:unnamed protein product [Callosobruchus analis]
MNTSMAKRPRMDGAEDEDGGRRRLLKTRILHDFLLVLHLETRGLAQRRGNLYHTPYSKGSTLCSKGRGGGCCR